jgi:uncharacterized cupin superfamily protein
MSETNLQQGDRGQVPSGGDGWFVLNVADADWKRGAFGSYTTFEARGEGERQFERMGINISFLAAGQPLCHYHGEDEEEFFLVLAGEAVLLVEEQERPLRAWDLVHTPPWVEHVIVGAGEGATLLAVGTRGTAADPENDVIYPRSELALRHGAGVEEETRSPAVSYAAIPPDEPTSFSPSWLPGG